MRPCPALAAVPAKVCLSIYQGYNVLYDACLRVNTVFIELPGARCIYERKGVCAFVGNIGFKNTCKCVATPFKNKDVGIGLSIWLNLE